MKNGERPGILYFMTGTTERGGFQFVRHGDATATLAQINEGEGNPFRPLTKGGKDYDVVIRPSFRAQGEQTALFMYDCTNEGIRRVETTMRELTGFGAELLDSYPEVVVDDVAEPGRVPSESFGAPNTWS